MGIDNLTMDGKDTFSTARLAGSNHQNVSRIMEAAQQFSKVTSVQIGRGHEGHSR